MLTVSYNTKSMNVFIVMYSISVRVDTMYKLPAVLRKFVQICFYEYWYIKFNYMCMIYEPYYLH